MKYTRQKQRGIENKRNRQRTEETDRKRELEISKQTQEEIENLINRQRTRKTPTRITETKKQR